MPKLQSSQTAIERFRAHDKIETSVNAVYATYTSGNFNGFYATEQEAIAHCSDPNSGAEFNGQWFQDTYKTYLPGELFSIPGNESVYISGDRSRFIDSVGGRWQMPFVEWKAENPLAV